MSRISPLGWLQAGLSIVLVLAFAAHLNANPAQRVISAGGSITEIIYALGQEHRLVARDSTSNHPPEAEALPDVGYVRRLSAEGLLSLDPDLILAEEGAGPPETLALLNETEIELVTIPMGFDRDAVLRKIMAVATALDVPEKGEKLAQQVGSAIDAATGQGGLKDKRVLFVLSLQGGRVLAGGGNTAAQGIIELAGASNAIEGFEGYKPMGDEAIITAAPDVVLMMNGGPGTGMSEDDVFDHPALAATPAGQNRDLIRMDGMLLLGFSVRTGEAVTELAAELRAANG